MRCRKDCGQGLLNNWLAKWRQKILGHAQARALQARALLAGQSLPVCKQLAGQFEKGYYECPVAGHDKNTGKLK